MNDLINSALFPVNLPFTILLAGLVGYWILVSFGIFDIEAGGDFFDLADADPDLPTTGGFLHFLNLGEVPLLVVLTIFTLSMWTCGLLAHFFFNNDSILLGLACLVPSFAVSTVVTRFVTLPLRSVFRALNRPVASDRSLVGQTCVIQTREATASYGQAEVTAEGAPILIQVRATRNEALRRGDTALIISQDAASGTFSVIPVTNEQLEP